MFALFLLRRPWIFAEGHFLGKVLDEWIVDAQEFVHQKLPKLIVFGLIAFLLNRLLHLITRSMIRTAEAHAANVARVGQVKTLASVVRATGFAVIGAIFTLQLLQALGIDLGPLLASAGVAGVAVGLAAQTIIKDMFNGMLILVEDQFSVGDVVKIAGVGGTVETMSLRKTTVRDDDGTLYVVPNSQITAVANLSREFSVGTINVSVDYSANPKIVIPLLESVAMGVRQDPAYKDAIIADPTILGVDAMKGSEVIYPVQFKTRARQQFGPMREFKRRIRIALEEQKLLPGDPYRVFHDSSHDVVKDRPVEGQTVVDPTAQKAIEINPFTGE